LNKFYYELTITPNSYYELYLDLVLSITNEAIEELDGSIIIRSEETLDDIKEGIELFIQQLKDSLDDSIEAKMTLEQKQNDDWVQKYKDAIEPVVIDEFYIRPSWVEDDNSKLNIIIDPALTFGSGHHETTSSCIKAIGKYVKSSHKVIDVGCGSGILSIAASKLGAICDICDTDKLCVEDSLKNFDINNVKCNASWEGSARISTDKYDVVIANIVADVLIMINKDLKAVASDGAILILSGILDKYEQKVLNKFSDLKLLEVIKKNEWVTIVLQKDNNE